ncbi:MAG: XRE family transcriptional regulator [Tannerellaceae bacterium]|jgi:transcriptional regulator with XRE-family HTH domain|nr:XRE family transcriptional regulator [Tannerellaceae bacterium]
METTVNERIKEIIRLLKVSDRRFAEMIGVPQTTVSNLFNRRTEPSYKILNAIINRFEFIDPEWLLTGYGQMHRKEDEMRMQVINHPKLPEARIEDQLVALYDVNAAANLKTLFMEKNQNILGMIVIPDMPRCDGAVYVKGDSMYPLLKSGDIVAYKELNSFSNVIYGEMYLLSFELDGDEYLTVKYANKSEREGYIKLASYNTHHEPMDIPIAGIYAMALIKVSIRMNTMR